MTCARAQAPVVSTPRLERQRAGRQPSTRLAARREGLTWSGGRRAVATLNQIIAIPNLKRTSRPRPPLFGCCVLTHSTHARRPRSGAGILECLLQSGAVQRAEAVQHSQPAKRVLTRQRRSCARRERWNAGATGVPRPEAAGPEGVLEVPLTWRSFSTLCLRPRQHSARIASPRAIQGCHAPHPQPCWPCPGPGPRLPRSPPAQPLWRASR